MRIRDMLVVARAGEPCGALLAIAAHVAREHDAQVEGVCVYSEPEEAIERHVAPVEAAYRAAIADAGLSRGWSIGDAEEHSWALIRQARLVDLVVVGLPGDDSLARRLAESFAINSGAPCMLVPCSAKVERFDRVLLAWDGSRESKVAMDSGLGFMSAAKITRVVIAHEDRDGAAHKAHGDLLLNHLARHRVEAELRIVHKPDERIGDILLAECQDFVPDLLVMGAYGHAKAREMVLGSATRTMLAQARQPVLMSH
jgi:nucleotide-binding universal stress UspA family protein